MEYGADAFPYSFCILFRVSAPMDPMTDPARFTLSSVNPLSAIGPVTTISPLKILLSPDSSDLLFLPETCLSKVLLISVLSYVCFLSKFSSIFQWRQSCILLKHFCKIGKITISICNETVLIGRLLPHKSFCFVYPFLQYIIAYRYSLFFFEHPRHIVCIQID